MNFITWTKEETEILIEAHSANLTPEQTKQAMNNTRSIEAIERKKRRLGLVREELPNADSSFDTKQALDRWEQIKAMNEEYAYASKYETTGLVKPTRKILSLSDIHFPFASMDLLKNAIDSNLDADICVLNGDIIDEYAFSTFPKSNIVPAITEYNTAFLFVETICKLFPKVVLIPGNHDVRAEKALQRAGMPKYAYEVLGTNLLARIANGERLDKRGKLIEKVEFTNLYMPGAESWWQQVGKTLFIHPHTKGSSKPAFTVSAWHKKFRERLPAGSFDSIVSGHTHQTSKHVENGCLLIEQGTLRGHAPYAWKPDNFFHNNAMNGYAVVYQDQHGNTDFNKSTFVYLGQMLPIDKPTLQTTANTPRYIDSSML